MTAGQVLWGTGSCVYLGMWEKKMRCMPFSRHGAKPQHWIIQYTVQVCMHGTHYSFVNVHLCAFDCNGQTTVLVVFWTWKWIWLWNCVISLCTSASEAVCSFSCADSWKSTGHTVVVCLFYSIFLQTLGFKKGNHPKFSRSFTTLSKCVEEPLSG